MPAWTLFLALAGGLIVCYLVLWKVADNAQKRETLMDQTEDIDGISFLSIWRGI